MIFFYVFSKNGQNAYWPQPGGGVHPEVKNFRPLKQQILGLRMKRINQATRSRLQ